MKKKESEKMEQPEAVQEVELTVEESLQKENEELKNELEKAKNDYYKAYADAQNYKKRMQRDHETMMKYRIQSFALEILPVIDNLERALSAKSIDESFQVGVQMIYDQLIAALKNEGVEEIDCLNQPFDPNYHQAIMTEAKEETEPNIVTEVFQKGYVLKDRVLRAAMVKVSE